MWCMVCVKAFMRPFVHFMRVSEGLSRWGCPKSVLLAGRVAPKLCARWRPIISGLVLIRALGSGVGHQPRKVTRVTFLNALNMGDNYVQTHKEHYH